jgi:uncharacterized protein YutE (UPF0331/DUF86 family)
MRKLRENGVLTAHVESCLKDAVEKRNFLVHHLFKENLATLYTEKDQDKVIV